MKISHISNKKLMKINQRHKIKHKFLQMQLYQRYQIVKNLRI